jgi:hypothetical protein
MLTEEQTETLEFIFEKMTKGDDEVMTAWERSFMDDQKERYEKYGASTRFSDRQWQVILRIEKSLVEGAPTR